MADWHPSPEPGPHGDAPPATPRWVKRSGIALAGLLLLLAVMHLTGHVPMHGLGAHQP